MEDGPTSQQLPERDSGMPESSGHEPSDERGRPTRKNARGGPGKKNTGTPSRDNLRNREQGGAGSSAVPPSKQVPDEEADFYTEPDKKSSGGLRAFFWGSRPRKTASGGGLVTLIVILALSFFASGPLEFVHLAQLMQRFHFQSQQDQSNDRFLQEVRFIRYKMKGQAYKANLGFFQNKIANTIESRMADAGFEPAYNNSKYGTSLDGWVIDPEKLANSSEELKGKSPAEVKQYLMDNNPKVEFKDLPNGKFYADLTDANSNLFGHRTLINLSKTGLKAAKMDGITGSLTARIMGKRAGSTWHPITRERDIQLSKLTKFLAAWYESIKNGTSGSIADQAQAAKNDKTAQAEAEQTAQEADAVVQEGQQAQAAAASGDTTAEANFKSSLNAKLLAGGLTAAGVACVLRGLDQSSAHIKQAQVVLPLVREAGNMIGLGNQVMSNQDLTAKQLGYYKTFLDGPSTQNGGSNADTSWIQAQSIQAELGNSTAGSIPPSKTLTTINASSPFHFLATGTANTLLSPVCSAPGQAFQIVIGFFGGDVETFIASGILQQLFLPGALDDAARWLAGSAADPLARGADFGSNVDFGSRLGANAQAVSSGGRALSSTESGQLTLYETQQSQADFQTHNLAYRLFNPYDERSAVSKLIDSQNPNLSKSVSSVAAAIFNVGHIFSSLASMFTTNAHAATATAYDYGFPQYGFSIDEMNNPAVKNPYKNAEDVVNTILPANPEYVGRVQKCFGVTIDPTTYAITSFGTDPIDPTKQDPNQQNFYSNPDQNTLDCSDSSTSWLQVRFYVFDSQTMESSACYLGNNDDSDIQQACSDIGFNGASTTTTSNGGSTTTSGASLVWPFATKSTGQYQRIDQGWDLQTTAGAPVYAVASGTLHVFNPDPGGFGNDYPTEELDSSIGGPTNWVYYGHVHIISSLNGKHVNAGQMIAYTNTSDPQNGSAAPAGWLEIGFATANTDAPVDPGSETVATQAGTKMHDILIGAPVGVAR